MSTAFIPNAVVDVYRDEDTSEDEWGYLVDNASPPVSAADAIGLPAYISQRVQTVTDPGSGQQTTVTRYTVRLRPQAFAFHATDRLKVTRPERWAGAFFLVDEVGEGLSIVTAGDIKLVCKRIGRNP